MPVSIFAKEEYVPALKAVKSLKPDDLQKMMGDKAFNVDSVKNEFNVLKTSKRGIPSMSLNEKTGAKWAKQSS